MPVGTITDPYADWIGGRTISSLGTNDGAQPLAFQSWHRFKEAFPPEVVHEAVSRSSQRVGRCLDPFGGSGTTALTCQMLGIESTTVEVNPFLTDVIRAKLCRYDVDLLVAALALVRRQSRKSDPARLTLLRDLPPSFIEPGVKGRWLFNHDVAARICAVRQSIDALEDEDARRLFRVVLGGMLMELSNVIVSGKGRRYRRNWSSDRIACEHVDELFSARAERAILDIQQFAHRPDVVARVIQGDARKARLNDTFDLAIFSPPYPNSFDYTDVYNVELWMLGYLTSKEENRKLRQATLTSHVQVSRAYSRAPSGSARLSATLERIEQARDTLWSPWIPAMVGGYFADLGRVVEKVRSNLGTSAECWLVVGDSSYAGVAIPVAEVLADLASTWGFTVQERTPFRHMKSSAQQGWRPQLAETLLVLRAT